MMSKRIKMKKVLWFDTETTGVNCKEHGIIQIAGMIEIDNKIVDTFDIKCQPMPHCTIDKEDLKVTGTTIQELHKRQSSKAGYLEFKNICEKHVNKFDKKDKLSLGAHNLKFDFNFLIKWSKGCNDKYLGSLISYKDHFCTLNTVQALKFAGVFPETENNKLETLCKTLGIELKNAHDAFFDIDATIKLGRRLLQILSSAKVK